MSKEVLSAERLKFPLRLPSSIIAQAMNPQECADQQLPETEQALVEKSIEKRKNEFKAGRILSRSILQSFGIDGYMLINSFDNYPIWPEGFCGSITHTKDYCAVAIANDEDIYGIGIDVEDFDRFNDGLIDAICDEDEISEIATLSGIDKYIYLALIFSAKESFYKCQYPKTKVKPGFKDVHINFIAKNQFTVTCAPSLKEASKLASRMDGYYTVDKNKVYTAALLTSE